MTQTKKPIEEAQKFVDQLKLDLMKWDDAKLKELIRTPIIEVVLIQGSKFEVTRWAQQIPGEQKLSVLAEARLSHAGGFWHSVTCSGFYKEPDGSISDMKEEDLWENGY